MSLELGESSTVIPVETGIQIFAFKILAGFRPGGRGPFVSAKGPKTIPPVRGPFGVPVPQHRIIWLRNSLRSNSARQIVGFDAVAQPRPRRQILKKDLI